MESELQKLWFDIRDGLASLEVFESYIQQREQAAALAKWEKIFFAIAQAPVDEWDFITRNKDAFIYWLERQLEGK